jgi:hypothetical protein
VWAWPVQRYAGGESSSAQEAARAAFAVDKAEDFYSSDEDTHSSASLSTTTSNAGLKFKASCLHWLSIAVVC